MRVFLIAGEPSGDSLGAALMAGLKDLCPDVSFDGVGGTLMQAQGLTSRFPMDELSVMGLAEVLPKYRSLKARIKQTANTVIETQPDVLITIDSPDFSFRVAKLVKAASSVRTVHYGAPTVWAWRPGRAAKIAKFIDHLLALFPFEPPYFSVHGMACDFVGHPIASEPVATGTDVAAFRENLELDDAPVLLVLPGSRRGEVSRLHEVFGASVKEVISKRPEVKAVVVAAASVAVDVEQAVAAWPVPAVVVNPTDMTQDTFAQTKRSAFRAADFALAASGTVSLELAAAKTPMVIAYKMQWLTAAVISKMLLVDTVTLVNLVSDTRSVREFLGSDCKPASISAALLDVLSSPQAQLNAMETTMARLGAGGEAPGLRAARAILARMPD